MRTAILSILRASKWRPDTACYFVLACLASLVQLSLMGVDSVPLINLLLSRLARDAVSLLNLPDQLIVLPVDYVDVIVGQFAPAFLYRTFHLFPFALQLVRVHLIFSFYFL